MIRSSLFFVICLFAASCAHVPEKHATLSKGFTLASAATPRVSAELECMSSCLGESDESGETCLVRCFD